MVYLNTHFSMGTELKVTNISLSCIIVVVDYKTAVQVMSGWIEHVSDNPLVYNRKTIY